MEIKEEILDLMKNNSEELKHAKDTLKWLLILNPEADEIQQICALGHDIERVINGRDDKEYNSHEEFKRAHSKRSAEFIKELMKKKSFPAENIERAYNIILKHEFGGNVEENLMRDSDSLANFEWCDDFFGIRGIEELKMIASRMYNRMSPENRKFIKQINFKNKEIKELI